MIVLVIQVLPGTTLSSAIFQMSYLANIVRIPVDGIYNGWRILIQPQDTPKELYATIQEAFKLENPNPKSFALHSYRYLYEALSDKEKQVYIDDYDKLMGN